MLYVSNLYCMCQIYVVRVKFMFCLSNLCSICQIYVLCIKFMLYVSNVCCMCQIYVVCFKFMLYVSNVKCYRNCSQNLRCLFLIFLLALALLLLFSISFFMISEDTSCVINCCFTINFVLSSHIVNIFFCVNSLYFPKL